MAILNFTEAEQRALEETVRKVLNENTAPHSASRGEDAYDVGEDHQAPETYVAKTPAGGIDALVDVGTGPGSPEVGNAECEIYAVDNEESELVKVADLDLVVYNIFEENIAADTFITVGRSKSGRWLALGGAGLTIKEGFLDDALGMSTGTGGGEATANLSVYTGTGDDWEDSGETITVTNRSDDLTADAGTYVIAARINGEWRPIWVDC